MCIKIGPLALSMIIMYIDVCMYLYIHRAMGLDHKNVLALFEKAMYLADIVIPQVIRIYIMTDMSTCMHVYIM